MAQKLVPIIPTVDRSGTRIVRDGADIVAKLLRFYFSNPGDVSDYFDENQISYHRRVAANEDEPATMAMSVEHDIQSVLGNYNLNTYTTTVSVKPIDEATYGLQIQIRDDNGNPVINITAIDVDGHVELQHGLFVADGITTN
jgi:hypothetical protein